MVLRGGTIAIVLQKTQRFFCTCCARRKSAAFTLIEVMLDATIIALIATAVLSAFSTAFKSIAASKAKITAVALANERMEIIRNLPYDSIATTTGSVPPGNIPSTENINRNNINFVVDTAIKYVDDPSDGLLGGSPPDPYFSYDYKQVEVKVRRSSSQINLVTLTTNIAANAAETSTNKGILYFCVIDSSNAPIDGASLTVQNDEVSPVVNISVQTGADGCVMVPELPPDTHNGYHLVVTKDGYSISMTYDRTSQNPNQLHPDIDILAQQVTRITMSIDKVSTININAYDLNGNPIPNLKLHLQDDYEIYFNPATYRYSQDVDLDAQGKITLNDMATANYSLSVVTAGYYLSSSNPVSPFYLAPDSSVTYNIYLTTSSTAPRIDSIVPAQGKITDAMTITVNGDNFEGPSPTMKLINPSTGIEIVATDVDLHSDSQVSGIFDLTLGSLGSWDVYVQNPGGEFSRKVGGFEIIP